MAPWYKHITSTTPTIPLDSALLDKMEAENKTELDALAARLAEAEKIEGETEISDALRARATYLTRIGDRVRLRGARCAEADASAGARRTRSRRRSLRWPRRPGWARA